VAEVKKGRYTWLDDTAKQGMVVCLDCGVVVADTEAHDKWHGENEAEFATKIK
jgi:transcription initiation factor TFIIIB Brf1 subunit/transcription initiation factor TFIIB